jgi:hypothetical protein
MYAIRPVSFSVCVSVYRLVVRIVVCLFDVVAMPLLPGLVTFQINLKRPPAIVNVSPTQ